MNPLDNVIDTTANGAVFGLQTGLFNLGRNRSLQSGVTEPTAGDIEALEDHARAMARDVYRDRFDPTQNIHDAMHQNEYDRHVAKREEAEKGEQHAVANLRDAEVKLARTPKAGPKPVPHPLLVTAAVVTIALTVAPTLHDSVFQTLGDDLLEWFAGALCAAFVGGMLTLAILHGRRTAWNRIGMIAGIALGTGLGVVRLASAQGVGEVMFAVGLTIVEIAAVLLLEHHASVLRAAEAEWAPRYNLESQAVAVRDAAEADLKRRQAQIRELSEAITRGIAFVEDRHNRNIHIADLEALAIKSVLDGYNAGLAENIGRVRGVMGRPE